MMFNTLLCTAKQAEIITALPIRVQRMITWYTICLQYHSDDLSRVDKVLDGQIIFYYPTKSGVNGAIDIVEQMNNRYTFNIEAHDFEVCKLLYLGKKKRIMLRWVNNTTHINKNYLLKRGNYA